MSSLTQSSTLAPESQQYEDREKILQECQDAKLKAAAVEDRCKALENEMKFMREQFAIFMQQQAAGGSSGTGHVHPDYQEDLNEP